MRDGGIMKKRIIKYSCAFLVLALIVCIAYNYCFFYCIPDTQQIDINLLSHADYGYEYPSDVLKVRGDNGYYQYPLIMIDEKDDSEYKLVHNGLISYEIDDTRFLKEHKMDLVVFQRGQTHSEYHTSFALYKDGECIDYVVCTSLSESFSHRSSTSELWFYLKYLLSF